MAKLESNFTFTGTLGNISSYKMRGVEGNILRTKGGPSREKIKNHPSFKNTRRINSEFGGRSSASKFIMRVLSPLKPLADHNIAGPINALLKPIQALDTESEYGKRNVLLSRNPHLLEGFNLNKKNSFDSIIRSPVHCKLSRDTASAQLDIPALLPGINFFVPPGNYSFYTIRVVLGMVPDLVYKDNGYLPLNREENNIQQVKQIDWQLITQPSEPVSIEIELATPPNETVSLLLGIGICFGTPGAGGMIEQVRYAGAAKVVRAM